MYLHCYREKLFQRVNTQKNVTHVGCAGGDVEVWSRRGDIIGGGGGGGGASG